LRRQSTRDEEREVRGGDAGGYRLDDKGREGGGRDAHGRHRDCYGDRERERARERERERERERHCESGEVRGGDAGGYRRDDKGRKDGGRDAHWRHRDCYGDSRGTEKFPDLKRNIDINKQIMRAQGASELCTLIHARVAEFNHVVMTPACLCVGPHTPACLINIQI
jgi:hypothetical protein